MTPQRLLPGPLQQPVLDLLRLLNAIVRLDGGWLFWAFVTGWFAWLLAAVTLVLHPLSTPELLILALLSSGLYIANALRLSGALLRHPAPDISNNHDWLNWAALLIGHGCAVVIMVKTQASGASAFILSIFSVLYAPYLNRLTQMPAAIVLLSSSVLIGWSSSLPHPWMLACTCVIQQSVLWLVGRSFLDQRAASRHFRTLHHRLEQAQQELYDASRLAERLRLSREIHDRLGHEITALHTLLQQPGDDMADARQTLSRLEHCFRDILTQTPAVASQPFHTEIETLLRQTPGLRIQCPRLPVQIDASQAVQQSVLLCLGETLTNCLKHSASDRVSLEFEQQDELLCIRITNAASRTRTGAPGMGLASMEQRLLQVGGHYLRHRPTPYLFVAELHFPARMQ